MDDSLGSLVAKLGADLTDLKKGLLDGKGELSAFKGVVETTAGQVKSLLKFAGISLGFYELISQAKEFGASILEAGAKVEVLRGAMYAIGQHYEISAASLDLYVNKLTEMGVIQDNALQGINNFLKAGISIDLLPQLAAAAKDLAPSMALPFNEAFTAIISAVTKGTPKALAELTPGIKQVLQAASSETKKLMDSTIMSGTERSQVMVDFVLEAAKKVQGAGDAVAGTYLKQLQDYKKAAHEAKEALFEIVKPISMGITGQEIKSWQDFYVWIVNNKQALRDLAEVLVVYVGRIANTARAVVSFISAHKDLAKTLLDVYLISKTAGWFSGIAAGAAVATTAVTGVSGALKALLALCGGPVKVVITIALLGLYEAYKAIQALRAEAGFTPKPFQVGGAIQEGRGRDNAAMNKATSESNLGGEAERRGVSSDSLEALIKENTRRRAEGKAMKPLPKVLPENETPEERAAREVAEGAAKGAAENALGGDKGGKGGKGGGGGKAEPEEDLWGAYWKMLEQKRQAEIQDATNSLELLKTSNEAKKAELEKQLAEGLIDGQTYYAKLQELQQGETAQALKLIDQKKTAQTAAYQEALKDLARQEMSPELRSYRQYEEAAKNRMEMTKLDTEAARTKLEGEKKVTDELKRQVETRAQYAEDTKKLNIDTQELLGQISTQEATLQKLTEDWLKAKQAAYEAIGGTPQYETYSKDLDANLAAKKSDTLYGGYSTAITSFFSSLTDALGQGMAELKKVGNTLFKSLFTEALGPSLKDLKGLLTSGFKDVFGEAASSISSAVMGVIGLVGMLATAATSKSFSSSGATSGTTTHEAVRGVISGDSSIDVSKLSNYFQDALGYEVVPILSQIEVNTRGSGKGSASAGGASQASTAVTFVGMTYDLFKEYMDKYFQNYLMKGAAA